MKKYLALSIMLFSYVVYGYSIDELCRIALDQNQNIKIQEEVLKQANYDLMNFYSDYLPNLSLSYDYTKYTSQYYPSSAIDRDYKSFGLSANMSMTVFSGGSKWLSYKAIKSDKRYESSILEDKKNEIVYYVKAACYRVIYSSEKLVTERENLKLSEEEVALMDEKFELGLVSKIDVLKMNVDYHSSKLALLNAQTNLEQAYRNLNHLVNFAPDSVYALDKKSVAVVDPPPIGEFLKRAEKSPRMNQIEESYNYNNLNTSQSLTSFFPSVVFKAGYSWGDDQFPDGMTTLNDDGIASFGVNMSWDIFTGGKRIISYQRSQSQKRNAEYSREYSTKSFINEIYDTYAEVIEAKSSYEMTLAQHESAKSQLDLVQEQFNLGDATVLELLDAKVSFASSYDNLITSMLNYSTSFAKMEWLCPED